MSDLYQRDFYAWANEQAALLRSGRLNDADILNIAEEMVRFAAAAETGLKPGTSPASCPWTAAEILDEDLWPG